MSNSNNTIIDIFENKPQRVIKEQREFDSYFEKRNKNLDKNIDELLDFNKEKLIQKLNDISKDINTPLNYTDTQLTSMPFYELWDMLIEVNKKKLTNSFVTEKNYDSVVKEIYNFMSRNFEEPTYTPPGSPPETPSTLGRVIDTYEKIDEEINSLRRIGSNPDLIYNYINSSIDNDMSIEKIESLLNIADTIIFDRWYNEGILYGLIMQNNTFLFLMNEERWFYTPLIRMAIDNYNNDASFVLGDGNIQEIEIENKIELSDSVTEKDHLLNPNAKIFWNRIDKKIEETAATTFSNAVANVLYNNPDFRLMLERGVEDSQSAWEKDIYGVFLKTSFIDAVYSQFVPILSASYDTLNNIINAISYLQVLYQAFSNSFYLRRPLSPINIPEIQNFSPSPSPNPNPQRSLSRSSPVPSPNFDLYSAEALRTPSPMGNQTSPPPLRRQQDRTPILLTLRQINVLEIDEIIDYINPYIARLTQILQDSFPLSQQVLNEFETMKYQTRNFKRQLNRELIPADTIRLKSVIDTFINKSVEIESRHIDALSLNDLIVYINQYIAKLEQILEDTFPLSPAVLDEFETIKNLRGNFENQLDIRFPEGGSETQEDFERLELPVGTFISRIAGIEMRHASSQASGGGISTQELHNIIRNTMFVPYDNYKLVVKFDEENMPKNYKKYTHKFEGQYYQWNDSKFKYSVMDQIKEILLNSKYNVVYDSSPLIFDIFLRRPLIEAQNASKHIKITEVDNLKSEYKLELNDGEHVILAFTDVNQLDETQSNIIIGLFEYEKKVNQFICLYMFSEELTNSFADINDVLYYLENNGILDLPGNYPLVTSNSNTKKNELMYISDQTELINTTIKFEKGYYSDVKSESYSVVDIKSDDFSFIKNPVHSKDRRKNKIFKYNRFCDDYKTKEHYFYLKQYIERLFNLKDIDDIENRDILNELLTPKYIRDLVGRSPVLKVEYYGYTDFAESDTGIDAGGIRPDFFNKLVENMINTFLCNTIKKNSEINTEKTIKEYAVMEMKPPANLDENYKPCSKFSKERCESVSKDIRQDDCGWNDFIEKCETSNLKSSIMVSMNDEKYNSFLRYGLPNYKSYTLVGALLARILLIENGGHSYINRIGIPQLKLSLYLISRLLNNENIDWLDMFTCLNLDNNTLYQEIVGVKCDMSKLYSADNIDTLSDELFNYGTFNMVSDHIKNHPDYETKYKEKFEANEIFSAGFDGETTMASKQNLLAHLYLLIVDYYEKNVEEEIFYLSQGFNLIYPKNLTINLNETPQSIGLGDIYNIFMGKGINYEGLLDITTRHVDTKVDFFKDGSKHFKSRLTQLLYNTYIINQFTFDYSEIEIKFYNKEDKLNDVDAFDIVGRYVIEQKRDNIDIEKLQDKIKESLNGVFYFIEDDDYFEIDYLYRRDTNVGQVLKDEEPVVCNVSLKDKDHIFTNKLTIILKNNLVTVHNPLYSHIEILETPTNSIVGRNLYIVEEDGGNKIVNKTNYYKISMKTINTKEQNKKLEQLLDFWTSNIFIPKVPKLTIIFLENSEGLPKSHTCFNQLDVPCFQTYESLEKAFDTSISTMNIDLGFTEDFEGEGEINNLYGSNSNGNVRQLIRSNVDAPIQLQSNNLYESNSGSYVEAVPAPANQSGFGSGGSYTKKQNKKTKRKIKKSGGGLRNKKQLTKLAKKYYVKKAHVLSKNKNRKRNKQLKIKSKKL